MGGSWISRTGRRNSESRLKVPEPQRKSQDHGHSHRSATRGSTRAARTACTFTQHRGLAHQTSSSPDSTSHGLPAVCILRYNSLVMLRSTLEEILRDQHPLETPGLEISRELTADLPASSSQAIVLTGARRAG